MPNVATDLKSALQGKCPDCGSELLYGPEAGMSVNVRCANKQCEHGFNITPALNMVERLSVAPDGTPLNDREERERRDLEYRKLYPPLHALTEPEYIDILRRLSELERLSGRV